MMVRFDVTLPLTREDVLDGLERAALRRASKGRLIAQTAALGFVFVWSLLAFALDDVHAPMSLDIALTAAAIAVVMWVAPHFEMRKIADDTVQSGKAVHLWVLEDGVDFGDETPETPYYTFGELRWALPTEKTRETIVWRTPAYDVIVVPKAALTEEQWAFLMEKAV